MTVMTKTELNEAIAATNLILSALQATLAGSTGLAGARTNYLCGQLSVYGADELYSGTGNGYKFWIDFRNCFEAAQKSGATFAAMGNVAAVASAMTPVSLQAIAVQTFSLRMVLVEQARILAATKFVSRHDIDARFAEINASFNAAELVAADAHDNAAYATLVMLHAAVSNDLTTRSRPLPQMIAYSFPQRMPSLWLAQRIYYDPSRNDELIAENKPIHPLFMPATGAALSS